MVSSEDNNSSRSSKSSTNKDEPLSNRREILCNQQEPRIGLNQFSSPPQNILAFSQRVNPASGAVNKKPQILHEKQSQATTAAANSPQYNHQPMNITESREDLNSPHPKPQHYQNICLQKPINGWNVENGIEESPTHNSPSAAPLINKDGTPQLTNTSNTERSRMFSSKFNTFYQCIIDSN